jgi:hypothetical protein
MRSHAWAIRGCCLKNWDCQFETWTPFLKIVPLTFSNWDRNPCPCSSSSHWNWKLRFPRRSFPFQFVLTLSSCERIRGLISGANFPPRAILTASRWIDPPPGDDRTGPCSHSLPFLNTSPTLKKHLPMTADYLWYLLASEESNVIYGIMRRFVKHTRSWKVPN